MGVLMLAITMFIMAVGIVVGFYCLPLAIREQIMKYVDKGGNN